MNDRTKISSVEGKKITKVALNTRRNTLIFYTGGKRYKTLFSVSTDSIFDADGNHFELDTTLTVSK